MDFSFQPEISQTNSQVKLCTVHISPMQVCRSGYAHHTSIINSSFNSSLKPHCMPDLLFMHRSGGRGHCGRMGGHVPDHFQAQDPPIQPWALGRHSLRLRMPERSAKGCSRGWVDGVPIYAPDASDQAPASAVRAAHWPDRLTACPVVSRPCRWCR